MGERNREISNRVRYNIYLDEGLLGELRELYSREGLDRSFNAFLIRGLAEWRDVVGIEVKRLEDIKDRLGEGW